MMGVICNDCVKKEDCVIKKHMVIEDLCYFLCQHHETGNRKRIITKKGIQL